MQSYYAPVPITGGALANKIIIDAVTGYHTSLILTQDNKLSAWGQNAYGMCEIVCNNMLIGAAGIGSFATPQMSPVFVDMTGVLAGKTISAMISTYGGFMVLDTNGLVYVWGDNGNGKNCEFFLLFQVK